MSDSDLKLLFPSFDLKLARILHTTLDFPREACNHLCEALILAKSTTWDWFITNIIDYGYVADLEYHVQTGYRSISMDNQHTLTTFVDLTYLINSQAGRNWYDHHQYTWDVFLAFCDTRDRSPGMAAIQNKANAMIPLAPLPQVTDQVLLASQLSVQAKPCLTKPVLSQVSSTTTTYVSTTAPASASPSVSVSVRPPATAPTRTPSYTWTYFPSTESVRFRKVVSSIIPTAHPDTPPGDASHITNRARHSPCPSLKPSANSRWTFHPKSATVTFHRSPKQFSSHKPSTCIPLLQLHPSGALAKDSAIPSSGHAYQQHGASSYPGRKPIYGAHSLTHDLPDVCITKRHRVLKLYHLHASLLVANWLYDTVT
eukprot:jgi/Psemu1/11760/gm1.11760_g